MVANALILKHVLIAILLIGGQFMEPSDLLVIYALQSEIEFLCKRAGEHDAINEKVLQSRFVELTEKNDRSVGQLFSSNADWNANSEVASLLSDFAGGLIDELSQIRAKLEV